MLTGFAPLLQLQNEMNRLFEDFLADMPALRPYGTMYPAVNVWEYGDCAYLEAELPGLSVSDIEVLFHADVPGVKSGDIDVSFEDGVLTIEGKVQSRHSQVPNYIRQEYGVGNFYRQFTLTTPINVDQTHAEMTNGELRLTVPKAESAKTRKIQIKTS
jgi:HSP20 family protein